MKMKLQRRSTFMKQAVVAIHLLQAKLIAFYIRIE
jgi:hypothetical protein